MKISILTLFPEMFAGPFDHSIIKRAKEKRLIDIELINIRDFGIGTHKMVDDTPYGGGVGMILKVDVLHKAIEYAKRKVSRVSKVSEVSRTLDTHDTPDTSQKVILMSASGKPYKQTYAKHFSTLDHLIIVCGHYEGVDERIINYVDAEITIGDFVLTGGELPAMVIVDSVVRLIDGTITEGATEDESFSRQDGFLEYPHYTKPRSYEDHNVPEVLLSGNHQKIAEWRNKRSLEKTKHARPDIIKIKDKK